MLPTRHIDTLHPAYGIRDSRTSKPSLTVPTPSVFGPVTRRRQASRQAGKQGKQAPPASRPARDRADPPAADDPSIFPFIHHSTSHQPRIASAGGRSSSTYVAAASRHPAGRSRVGPSTYTPAASPASFLPCLPCVLPSIFGRRGRRSGTMKRSERVRLSQMCRLYR